MKPKFEDHVANAVTGLLLGTLFGATTGLSVCIWLLAETLFFAGDTVLLGAIICGTLGWWYGDRFIDWLKENWEWFW